MNFTGDFFCGGFFCGFFSGLFPWGKQEKNIHPKIHSKIQIRIWQFSTLQGSGLEFFWRSQISVFPIADRSPSGAPLKRFNRSRDQNFCDHAHDRDRNSITRSGALSSKPLPTPQPLKVASFSSKERSLEVSGREDFQKATFLGRRPVD